MDAFRGEYEKLFAALEKSHKNEKRLNTKCQELGSEIASQQARVDAAKGKTREDEVKSKFVRLLYFLSLINIYVTSVQFRCKNLINDIFS